MNPSVTVAGLGLTITDILMTTDVINIKNKNPVSHQTLQMGGVVSTALMVLSRLGIKTDFFSAVGNDMFGHTLISIFQHEMVGCKHVELLDHAETPLSCVILHDKDQRTIFYTSGPYADWQNPGFSQALPPETSHLLVDGHNIALAHEFLDTAQKRGIKTMLDLGNPKKGKEDLVAKSYGVIIPQAYWRPMHDTAPRAIVEDYLTRGPSLVILTMGEEGSLIGTKEHIFHQPSWKVHAIDTNGAGDVFFGSFVYGLVQNWSLENTARFASAAAARSCTIVGKHDKLPRSEKEIHDFIATNSQNVVFYGGTSRGFV
jgi:sulfofructose kinase